MPVCDDQKHSSYRPIQGEIDRLSTKLQNFRSENHSWQIFFLNRKFLFGCNFDYTRYQRFCHVLPENVAISKKGQVTVKLHVLE